MLIADLAVVLLLMILFHRMRRNGYDETAERLAAENSANDRKAETEWQKKHDQWWQAHQGLKTTSTSNQNESRSAESATPGSAVGLSQLERSNHILKNRINQLNRKISILQNGKKNDSYQKSDWYRQIVKMRKQIAKLKSEYKWIDFI